MQINFKHLMRLLFSLSITACALALMCFYIWTRGELYRVFIEPGNVNFIEQSVIGKLICILFCKCLYTYMLVLKGPCNYNLCKLPVYQFIFPG